MEINVIIPFHEITYKRCHALIRNLENCCTRVYVILDHPSITEKKIWYDSKPHKNIITLVNDTGIRGPAATRDIGLKHTTGRWVLFQDSDDLIDWATLWSEVKTRKIDAKVCYCIPMLEIKNGVANNRFPARISFSKFQKSNLMPSDFFIGGLGYNKIIFFNKGCLHDTVYFQGEDLLFRIKLITLFHLRFEFLCIEPLYTSIRQTKNSTTNVGSHDEIENWMIAARLFKGYKRFLFVCLSKLRYCPTLYKLIAKPFRLLRKYYA